MHERLEIDPKLFEFASPLHRERLKAVNEFGGARAAGKALGINKNLFHVALKATKRRAAQAGYSPDHDMTKTVPDGFTVKGVSTYYDRDGKARGQWVKSAADGERRAELLREFVENLAESAKGLAPLTPAPTETLDDLLAIYLFGDPHFGMRAMKEEAGEDFDLAAADRITRGGIDQLVRVTPPAREALLINAGDNTHTDDSTNRTRGHGNQLDVDGRHYQAVLVSANAWVYAIQRLLERHETVTAWFIGGNHDHDTAFALAVAISMFFHAEPRVTVEVSPSAAQYKLFGDVLIGACHGDMAKAAEMPLIMAVDRPEEWGKAKFRYIYLGHVHHDTVREIQGVRVETLRTLAPSDAWHRGMGYRAMRDTRSIVMHRRFAEVQRHTCNVALIEDAA